jgi:uncharacterized protein YjbI with pentapeptide repeats
MKLKKQIQANRSVSRRANIERLKEGTRRWNAWCAAARARNPDWRADLRGANLAGLELSYMDFRRAILSGADLRAANCSGSNFRSASLRGADLEKASLDRADLRRANLNSANLSHAQLWSAKLESTHFFETRVEGTQLGHARIGNTYFVDVKIDAAVGLESVRHYGSSHLSLGTLLRSGSNLPKSFLRGCGVPPLFHKLLGDAEEHRRLAFQRLQEGSRLETPERYVMHLHHGWRAQRLQRFLNKNTRFSWHLIRIASRFSLREANLHTMPKSAIVPFIVNPRYFWPWSGRGYRSIALRPIFRRLESARKRHRFKIVVLSWEKSKLFDIFKHRWLDLDEFSPLGSRRFDSKALARKLELV